MLCPNRGGPRGAKPMFWTFLESVWGFPARSESDVMRRVFDLEIMRRPPVDTYIGVNEHVVSDSTVPRFVTGGLKDLGWPTSTNCFASFRRARN